MSPRFFALAVCSLTLLACGGNVAVHDTGGRGGSTTGSTGGTGATGATGGWAGEGGIGGIGGTGGACSDSNDSFSFTLTAPDGTNVDCTGVQQGQSKTVHIEGVVTASTSTTLTLETCPPGTACDPATYTLAVESPAFMMNVFTGEFVQLDVAIHYPWGCTGTILARNLPVFGGQPGPGGNVPWFIFAGSDGVAGAPDGAPFTVSALPLGCGTSGQSCGPTVQDSYRFDVLGATVTSVFEGEMDVVSATDVGGPISVLFRNLRSYESGWCDDYWNYAWWATQAPIPD
jgi:hypothetical protein